MSKQKYLLLTFLILSIAVAAGSAVPEALVQLLDSPLAPYSNGTSVIDQNDFSFVGSEYKSEGFELTVGQYHFQAVLEAVGGELPAPESAQFRVEQILSATSADTVKSKHIYIEMFEQPGRLARADLDCRILDAGQYRYVLSFSSEVSVDLKHFIISPRFTSNIPPMASAEYAGSPEFGVFVKKSKNLNGHWQLQPARDDLLFYPEDDKWHETPIRIPSPWNVNKFNEVEGADAQFYPSYPKEWESLEAVWLRKTFSAPEQEGQLWRLHFDAVMYSAEVYVNGHYIGFHEGGFDAFSFDVTEVLEFGGENEVLVGVRSFRPYTMPGGGRPLPWGSFWGMVISGIWQDVRLESGGPVQISNVHIIPLDKPKRLKIAYEFFNSMDKEVVLGCASRIEPCTNVEGFNVPDIETIHITLKPRSIATHTMEIPWEKPHLWDPDDPFLYNLSTSLTGYGAHFDNHTERFGFRLFEIRGSKVFINDKRTKLRGDAWHFIGTPNLDRRYPAAWYQLCRDSNVNMVRLHAQLYPRYYITTADEQGMLITDESSHWASGLLSWYDDDFYSRMREHLAFMVRRDRNSPSVIAWSAANELKGGYGSWPYCNVESIEKLEADYGRLLDFMREMDSTRPVYCDGDFNLGGRADWFSFHYPGAGTIIEDKPVTIGESTKLYYASPADVAAFGGEEVFSSWDARCEAVAGEFMMQMGVFRRWAEGITPFNVVCYSMQALPVNVDMQQCDEGPERYAPYSTTLNPGLDPKLPLYRPNPAHAGIVESMKPVQIFPLEYDSYFYSGQLVSRKFNLHNDTRSNKSFIVDFTYYSDDGSVIRRGQRELNVFAGEYKRMAFSAPVALLPGNKSQSVTLSIKVSSAGKVYIDRSFDYMIHSKNGKSPLRSGFVSSTRRLVVLEKSALLSNILPEAEDGVQDWDQIISSESWRDGVIVIGEGVELSAEQVNLMRQGVRENGLRVVVLGECFSLCGADGFLKSVPGNHPIVFPTNGDHPVTEGLQAGMLRYWEPKKFVAVRSFDRLTGKRTLPVLSTGDGKAVVLEIQDGTGLYIYSGMDLLDRYGKTPVADILLTKLMRRAVEYSCQPACPVVLAASVNSDAANVFEDLRVDFESFPYEGIRAEKSLIVLDCDYLHEADLDKLLDRIQICLDGGARLFLWGLAPEHKQIMWEWMTNNDSVNWIERVLSLCLEEADTLQLVRSEETKTLLAGVHEADLYQLEQNRPTLLEYVLKPGQGIDSLLELPDIEWRQWVIPWQTEPLHINTMYRSMAEGTQEGIAYGRLTGSKQAVYIYQVPADSQGVKSSRVLNQILSNLGAGYKPNGSGGTGSFNVDRNAFIRSWWVLGPFQGGTAKEVFAKDFLAEQGGAGAIRPSEQTGWMEYRSDQAVVSIDEIPAVGYLENAALYFATYIYSPRRYGEILDSPEALNLRLSLGSDDGAAAWLNGREIFRTEVPRPHRFDQDQVGPLHLKAGWNLLIVEVFQYSAGWQMSSRILDTGGLPVSDLIYSLTPEY